MNTLVGLPGLGYGQWQSRYLQRKTQTQKKEQGIRTVPRARLELKNPNI
jgi:hypothetical protein